VPLRKNRNMNKSEKNSPFSSTAAPGTGCHNLRSLSWRKFLGGIALLLIVSLTLGRAAQSVTLAWDPVPGSNIAGYKLHYGTTSGRPSKTVDVRNRTTAKVSALNDGTTYFFSVSAYNTRAVESRPSQEISYRTAAPTAAAAFTGILTVHSGSGSGNYAPGTQVRVGANAAPAGKRFASWTGDVAVLANLSSSTTTATMPYTAVTITASYCAVDRIRYYPRPEWRGRMVGGIFEGTSGDRLTGTYTPIYRITTKPPQAWSEVSASLGSYRYLRYRGPNNSYGNVAEIEFYRGGQKIAGTGYGTSGSWNNYGSTFAKALDGKVNTFFDGPLPDGMYVGVDTATPAKYALSVNSGTGGGNYVAGTQVRVSANAAQAGEQFAGWTGDVAILANPSSSATTATVPYTAVAVTASYRAVDKIRYYPRPEWRGRMVGGIFEGTSADRVIGTYTPIYRITTKPPQAWSEVSVSLGRYRYLRYRGPNNSYGNVAEIEFHRDGKKITGAGYGTSGSRNNHGSTFAKALDGKVDTFFDGPTPNGMYVGMDTATPAKYALSVNRGTGSGNYKAGTQVTVAANAAPAGKRFAGWTGNLAILANPSSSTTTATMPSTAVAITASYSGTMPPTYALTVNSGGGGGTYPAGTVVKLTADPPPPGMRFAGWRLNTSALANRSAANTTLIMPARKLTLSATYKR
jgi:hypothetical protein